MSKPAYDLENKIYVIQPEGNAITAPLAGVNQSLRKAISIIGLVVTDSLSLILALWVAVQIRLYVLPAIFPVFPERLPPQLFEKLWWALAITIMCLAYERLYTRRLSFWRETKRLLAVISLAYILMLAFVSLAKLGGEVSRTVLVVGYFISLFVMPLGRYIGKTLLGLMGVWKEPVVIIGTGNIAQAVADALIKDSYLGYKVVGFLQNNKDEDHDSIQVNKNKIPILGNFEDAAKVLSQQKIRHIIIASPELPGKELVSLTNQLQRSTRSMVVVPDLSGIPVVSGEADYFFEEQIIAFHTRNNLASRINIITKRLFDIVVGVLLLIPLIPLLLLIALIIKIDSQGPAIYSGNRIGRHGIEFKCYKFRTMFLNNDEILEQYFKDHPEALEEWQKYAKLKGDDPRVTRVGKYLRKLSLDELPQIINVIKGEMSLVGARPYLPREKEDMGEYADTILMANPGITGLWQVSGRNEIDFQGRVQLETWYVRNWSLWLDITLLFRTIGVVLGRKGAY
ncbi:MAG: undecaprenyl-phosphate galactose phosphotransferase WbaP [Syntrophomonadaceae bacterium]|nr:undecaprenyl-phosphate galactose phosphotransferase WbaP [Syntrophomonadaceae bacterium]